MPLSTSGVNTQPTLRKERAMFYVKNLPHWQRAMRLIMGALALIYAASNWGRSGLAVGAGLAGAMVAMTGLIGFCPMCAMLGHKLDQDR